MLWTWCLCPHHHPSPQVHVLKLMWWYLEVGTLGDNEVMRVLPSWTSPLRDKGKMVFLSTLVEDSMRGCHLQTRGRASQGITRPVPGPWTSQPPDLWETNFPCLNHPVYGICYSSPYWLDNRCIWFAIIHRTVCLWPVLSTICVQHFKTQEKEKQ